MGKQGVFFEGQIFDAWQFASNHIKSAKHTIVLIDSYFDDSVFVLLSKRQKAVIISNYTGKITSQMVLDLKKQIKFILNEYTSII